MTPDVMILPETITQADVDRIREAYTKGATPAEIERLVLTLLVSRPEHQNWFGRFLDCVSMPVLWAAVGFAIGYLIWSLARL